MPNIPSVDLNNFLSDDQSLKQEFVNKLGKAYQDIGFVALKGHFLKDSWYYFVLVIGLIVCILSIFTLFSWL